MDRDIRRKTTVRYSRFATPPKAASRGRTDALGRIQHFPSWYFCLLRMVLPNASHSLLTRLPPVQRSFGLLQVRVTALGTIHALGTPLVSTWSSNIWTPHQWSDHDHPSPSNGLSNYHVQNTGTKFWYCLQRNIRGTCTAVGRLVGTPLLLVVRRRLLAEACLLMTTPSTQGEHQRFYSVRCLIVRCQYAHSSPYRYPPISAALLPGGWEVWRFVMCRCSTVPCGLSASSTPGGARWVDD